MVREFNIPPATFEKIRLGIQKHLVFGHHHGEFDASDVIALRELDPEANKDNPSAKTLEDFTGREIRVQVTFISSLRHGGVLDDNVRGNLNGLTIVSIRLLEVVYPARRERHLYG